MRRRTSRPSRTLLVASLLPAAAAACGGRDAAPAPVPPREEEAAPSVQETPSIMEGPVLDVRPAWPAGWKELERGQAGPAAGPLIWYRIDAGGAAPDAAARAVLATLRPHAGAIALEDVAVSRDEPVAIAHLRGARLTGVAEARTQGGRTEVRVTLEPAP